MEDHAPLGDLLARVVRSLTRSTALPCTPPIVYDVDAWIDAYAQAIVARAVCGVMHDRA